MTKSRSGHVRHLLVASACLAYLVVATVDGHLEFGGARYVPGHRYYYYSNNVVDPVKTIAAADAFKPSPPPSPFRPWPVERSAEEDSTRPGDAGRDIAPSPLAFQMNLKKKNSEIISVLMGLRRAMSNNYGNGVGERRLHDNNAF